MHTETYSNYRELLIAVVGGWSFITLRANVGFSQKFSFFFSLKCFLHRLYLQPFWSLQRCSNNKIWLFIRDGFRSPQTVRPNKSVHFWIENVWYESFTFKLCKKPPDTCQLGVPATRPLVPVSLFLINEMSQDMVGRPKMPLVEFCGDRKLGIQLLSLVPNKSFTLLQSRVPCQIELADSFYQCWPLWLVYLWGRILSQFFVDRGQYVGHRCFLRLK